MKQILSLSVLMFLLLFGTAQAADSVTVLQQSLQYDADSLSVLNRESAEKESRLQKINAQLISQQAVVTDLQAKYSAADSRYKRASVSEFVSPEEVAAALIVARNYQKQLIQAQVELQTSQNLQQELNDQLRMLQTQHRTLIERMNETRAQIFDLQFKTPLWVIGEGSATISDDRSPQQTRQLAIDYARRNALEKSAGLFVSSVTIVKDNQVVEDSIKTEVHAEILQEDTNNGYGKPVKIDDGDFGRYVVKVRLYVQNKSDYNPYRSKISEPPVISQLAQDQLAEQNSYDAGDNNYPAAVNYPAVVENEGYRSKYNYALNEFKQRKFYEAIDDFRLAIEINPNSGEAYYYLGYCFWCIGNRMAAVNNFNDAVRLDPAYAESAYPKSEYDDRVDVALSQQQQSTYISNIASEGVAIDFSDLLKRPAQYYFALGLGMAKTFGGNMTVEVAKSLTDKFSIGLRTNLYLFTGWSATLGYSYNRYVDFSTNFYELDLQAVASYRFNGWGIYGAIGVGSGGWDSSTTIVDSYADYHLPQGSTTVFPISFGVNFDLGQIFSWGIDCTIFNLGTVSPDHYLGACPYNNQVSYLNVFIKM